MVGVGERLGPYELVARLARGGMATLYLARRRGSDGFTRHVAVKVLHPHLAADGSFVDMLVDEAKLSARIRHPHVVHVEDLGEERGTRFLVMEYVHGCSLAELLSELALRGMRVCPELAVHVALAVAEGLDAAHRASGTEGRHLGIVHRDVSPQNVLLSYQGHVKLIDFGIARALGAMHRTGQHRLKGRVRYMAPEQATGKSVDSRADVYALGAVLWEMLAMRRLVQAEDDMAALAVAQSPSHDPPSRWAAGISPALDAAVMQALARSPDGRPATGRELRRALAAACPDALGVETTDLADLLLAVMRSRIREQHAELPAGVAEVEQTDSDLARIARPAGDTSRELSVLSALTREGNTDEMFAPGELGADGRDQDEPPIHAAPTRVGPRSDDVITGFEDLPTVQDVAVKVGPRDPALAGEETPITAVVAPASPASSKTAALILPALDDASARLLLSHPERRGRRAVWAVVALAVVLLLAGVALAW